MKRPIGITLLSILVLVSSAYYILYGIGLWIGWVRIPAQIQVPPEAVEIVPIAFLVVGAVGTAIGLGLWYLMNWARIAAIVLSVLGVLGAIFGVGNAVSGGTTLQIVWSFVSLAIRGVILWYLLQPHVKEAFTAEPPPAAAMPT